MRSATVSILRLCSLQNSMSCGTRDMVPSSFMISQMTPAGLSPAMRGSVDGRHEREMELVAALFGERHANQAAAVLSHEVDGVGRDLFGGHGEVAFVFAVLVVDEDDHTALANFLDSFFNGGERGTRSEEHTSELQSRFDLV